jgi:hypothetical protein
MNKNDSSRPLDARPGHDPFDGQDPTYSCDTIHKRGTCQRRFVPTPDGHFVMTSKTGHNKLLGGHGNDTIYAGPWGDVIWGRLQAFRPAHDPARHDLRRGRPRLHLRQPRDEYDPRGRRRRRDQGPLGSRG